MFVNGIRKCLLWCGTFTVDLQCGIKTHLLWCGIDGIYGDGFLVLCLFRWFLRPRFVGSVLCSTRFFVVGSLICFVAVWSDEEDGCCNKLYLVNYNASLSLMVLILSFYEDVYNMVERTTWHWWQVHPLCQWPPMTNNQRRTWTPNPPSTRSDKEPL